VQSGNIRTATAFTAAHNNSSSQMQRQYKAGGMGDIGHGNMDNYSPITRKGVSHERDHTRN
jgi:hypothetical protein